MICGWCSYQIFWGWWYNICKVENRTDDIVDITVIHGVSSMMRFPDGSWLVRMQLVEKSSESWMDKFRLASGVHNLRFLIWNGKPCCFHVCGYDITTQLQKCSNRCWGCWRVTSIGFIVVSVGFVVQPALLAEGQVLGWELRLSYRWYIDSNDPIIPDFANVYH